MPIEKIKQGYRSIALEQYAQKLKEFGHEFGTIEYLTGVLNVNHCDPPVAETELSAIVNSIWSNQ